jgi:hypothetical protein
VGEAKRRRRAYGVDRQGRITWAPQDVGGPGSELFDVNPSTDRIRPWQERRGQACAVAAAYRAVFAKVGDIDIDRIGRGCACCGTALGFEELYAEAIDETKLRLKRANFCRGRLCPMCNWRRSLKLKNELVTVLAEVWKEHPTHRLLMLTLTEPNASAEDFGASIARLLAAFARLTKRRRWKRAVRHWFRALEVSPGRGGTYHGHFHVLLVVPAEYFDPGSSLYISHDEWRQMGERSLRAAGRRIVDIRVTENATEVAKYVTKPGAYLKLKDDGAWWCDPARLETLHYALGSRRLVAWSRSLSVIRRKLGFLTDDDDQSEDLIDVGEDYEPEAWVPFREVLYRWRRNEEGKLAYYLWTSKVTAEWDPDACEVDYDFGPDPAGWYDDYDPDPGPEEEEATY